MTDGIGKEGSNGDQPQKKGLDLSIFLKHVAQADTSIGRVFLFPLLVSDISEYAKLPDQPSSERIRGYLPCIVSLSADYSLDKERVAITAEQLDQLSGDEIEALAEAYASSSVFRETREGSKDRAPVARESGETATAYLDRLLRHETEEQAKQTRKILESALGSKRSIFDQVRKSSLSLGSTISEYARLSNRSTQPEVLVPRMDHMHAINDQFARQARERAEELEMVRLTGKMTAESAQTLKDLAEAATNLLEQLDDRDKKSDKSTRTQIRIAVWSVGISALLALFALIVSGFAYFQDQSNNRSGDKWQAAVLSELEASNGHRASIQAENKLLREQVQRLASTVAVLEGKVKPLFQETKQASTEKKK